MAAFGSATNLVGGTITLDPIQPMYFWFIHNQDSVELQVTFVKMGGQDHANVILEPAPSAGGRGGYINSNDFPHWGQIILTSTKATHQFGSGASSQPNRTST